ncbi:hypothetical protein SUDANB171_03553 [Streptomyces sp. enrichment culture]|uniref:asparagine synthase-related protein n=1 Tax=Streptomyces sp. enrichment culture TaxID=1795815 RepID=UPI003F567DE3
MPTWWIILPDTAEAAALVERLDPAHATYPHVVRHSSGRPWLLGRWRGPGVISAEAGSGRVTVLGRSALTAETLRARFARVRDHRDLANVMADVPGSYHVLASLAGQVWARGTAMAACRLFTTRVDGVPVAGPHADALAQLTGAEPDVELLSGRLAHPPIPWTTVTDRTIWRRVTAVHPHDALRWDRDGTQHTQRWWSPPDPVLPLPEAAQAVRGALEDSVATCTSGGGTISADLSGGLDSASVCFLTAARRETSLVTFRWDSVDPSNDDAVWARRATNELPDSPHVVIGSDETPDWFTGIGTMRLVTDEPVNWARDVVKLSDTLSRARAHGSRLHLTGCGGDEILTPLPAYLADQVRSHPVRVLGRLRHHRLDWHLSRTTILRALLDNTPYPAWLRRAGDRLTAPRPPELTDLMSWRPEPRLPVWATPDAVAATRTALRDAAEQCPGPLAPQRSVHGVLQQMCESGNALRELNRAMPGPEYAYPYNDDAVVTAALSAHPLEAAAPGRYKPLLTTAMHGIVPQRILARDNKGVYDADYYRAVDRRRGDILALLDSSHLARAGVIDPEALRRVLHSFTPLPVLAALIPTVACEIWLRSLPSAPGEPLR